MGSSLSCLCGSKKHVFVIKHDGNVMRVKAGTRVKEIVAANPCHTVLRGGPGHSISALPGSFVLGGHGLYFIVPEGQILCMDTVNSALVKLGHSGKLGGSKTKRIDEMKLAGNSNSIGNQVMVFDASSQNKKFHWTPALHTISETTSSLERSS